MKRSYWIMSLSVFVFILITSVVFVIIAPKAATPELIKNNITTGPLTIYYTAIDDNGQSGDLIGCGDSVVSIQTAAVSTDDIIKATFDNMLSNHSQYYGESGLYNVLYDADLKFINSSVSAGVASVYLTGVLNLRGVCDNPRVQAVLESTAKSAAGVNQANIFINSVPLSEVLSLK